MKTIQDGLCGECCAAANAVAPRIPCRCKMMLVTSNWQGQVMANRWSWQGIRRAGGGLVFVAWACAVAACGGGGNGAVRPTPESPPPPTPTTPQPPIDAQLSITNTYAARSAGYTGQGVTIGIVDSGIMRSNPTVAGRVTAEYIWCIREREKSESCETDISQ